MKLVPRETLLVKRKPPTLSEKLAAALMQLSTYAERDGRMVLVPIVDREAIKAIDDPAKAADSVRAMFECDHDPIPVALGGTNHPANLTHRIKAGHRHKTAKKDVPAIAKVKRLSEEQIAFRARLASAYESAGAHELASRFRSRPMPGTKASGQRKRMSGKVEKR